MSIEITRPRHAVVPLHHKKKGQYFIVDKLLSGFLKWRGWHVREQGKDYATVVAPRGAKPPFIFEVSTPSSEQILSIARATHERGQPWADFVGEWPAVYDPPRRVTTQSVDPFTGGRGDVHEAGTTDPWFHVGYRGFWDVDIRFSVEGMPYIAGEASAGADEPDFCLPEEVPPSAALLEGAVTQIQVNSYERNPEARRQCIAAHGTSCYICGFDFERVYGAEAEGFIHVHHTIPLSEIRSEYVVDPVNDLRPLCPNCHAFIHLNGKCRSVEEVRDLILDRNTVHE